MRSTLSAQMLAKTWAAVHVPSNLDVLTASALCLNHFDATLNFGGLLSVTDWTGWQSMQLDCQPVTAGIESSNCNQ